MAQARANTIQQEREVYAALQYAAIFTVWWKNGKIVENLSPCQKKSEPS